MSIETMVDQAIIRDEVERDPLLSRAFADPMFLMAFVPFMEFSAKNGREINAATILQDAKGFAQGMYGEEDL